MFYPAHFADRLERRFHIPYTEEVKQKILTAIGNGDARFKCKVKDEKGTRLLFYTRIFGIPMMIVVGKNGELISCHNPSTYAQERGR